MNFQDYSHRNDTNHLLDAARPGREWPPLQNIGNPEGHRVEQC
jgi:hypothetical protein